MNYVKLEEGYIKLIAQHQGIRFIIIFLLAFLLFSLNIDKPYNIWIRLLAAFTIASAFYFFLTANTTFWTPLIELEEDKKLNLLK